MSQLRRRRFITSRARSGSGRSASAFRQISRPGLLRNITTLREPERTVQRLRRTRWRWCRRQGGLDEAYIVHESLHAAYDLLRTGLDANAEEASAYVCTALYCRMTGLPRPRWANGPIYANAAEVARTLLSQYQKGDPGIPWVGEHEWRLLRAGVGLDPVYTSGPAGILTGWLLGQQYTHDG